MPKYIFKCEKCNAEIERFASISTEQMKCASCEGTMQRQFPSAGSKVVREVVDHFTNVRHVEDQKEQDAKRKQDHFWEVQVPRLIQEYSLETCLQEGWLVYNDKNELVVNKPPSKR